MQDQGKDIRIGAFRGLLTSKGQLRLQMRTEQGSMLGSNVSYAGDLELSGGRIEVEDLCEALTIRALLDESAREVREELGILVGNPPDPILYRAVFQSPDGWEDWAFVIPTPPDCWDEKYETSRKTVDVYPDQLLVLGDLNLVISGTGKRMWSMAMASLLYSSDGVSRRHARGLLNSHRPDWRTELIEDPEAALLRFQEGLGLT